MRILIPIVLLVFAGCLTPVEVEDGPTWFGFSGSGRLLQENTGGSGYLVEWGWTDYVAGVQAPTWQTGSFETAAYVTDMHLQLAFDFLGVVSTEAPVRPFSRPQLTAWVGVAHGQDSIIAHEFADGPTAAAVGNQEVSWDIELPPGGLYVPEGSSLIVRVGSYYLQYEGVRLDGSESHLDVTLEPAPTIPADRTAGQATVQVAGGACSVRDPTGVIDPMILEAAMVPVTLDVHEGARFLEVRATTAYGDMDFFLVDPAGETVAHALGSGSQEALLLGPATLEGRAGQWTIVVYPCSPIVGSVDLAWDLYFDDNA